MAHPVLGAIPAFRYPQLLLPALLLQLCPQGIHLPGQDFLVQVHHVPRSALGNELALVQQHHLVAVFDDTAHIVGHHQDRGSALADFLHPAIAFGLKKYVAHGQRLVHDQNLRLHIDGQRKSQPYKHTAGVSLDRLVHEIPDLREVQNIVQLRLHLFFRVTHHGAVHVYIFNSRVIHVETGAQLQQGGNLSVHLHLARARREHAGDNL